MVKHISLRKIKHETGDKSFPSVQNKKGAPHVIQYRTLKPRSHKNCIIFFFLNSHKNCIINWKKKKKMKDAITSLSRDMMQLEHYRRKIAFSKR